ncbi:MAG: low affinity iron permease family protein [Dehalococcoidia bacterium]
MSELFERASRAIAVRSGSPAAFLVAFSIVLAWAITGPLVGFSDTWQLVINTGTTVITFLMVFLIQNTQNHDSTAVQLKLDELIHAVSGARDEMIDLEEQPTERLSREQDRFRRVASRLGAASDELDEASERAAEAADALLQHAVDGQSRLEGCGDTAASGGSGEAGG